MKPRKCQPYGLLLRVAPCGGPLYEAKGYCVEGESEYRCENHALALMRMYPKGPTFRKVQEVFAA